MRTLLAWILIAHTLHVPIPVPDLDGECRGAPISSLSEAQAWHVMIIGVRPNDDIDRGPIRTTGDSDDQTSGETPFDAPTIVAARALHCGDVILPLSPHSILCAPSITAAVHQSNRQWFLSFDGTSAVPSPTAACVSFCTWQV